jgi:hypothetical protein
MDPPDPFSRKWRRKIAPLFPVFFPGIPFQKRDLKISHGGDLSLKSFYFDLLTESTNLISLRIFFPFLFFLFWPDRAGYFLVAGIPASCRSLHSRAAGVKLSDHVVPLSLESYIHPAPGDRDFGHAWANG